MSNGEDDTGKLNRNISPKIDTDKITINVEKELHTPLKETIEIVVRDKIYEKLTFEAKCEKLWDERRDFRAKANDLQKKLDVANAKLDTRPFLEVTESEVVPQWLRNAKWLNHVDKWYLSFRYEVIPCAKILRRRLDQQYDCRKLSESLVVMYDVLSTKISHDGTSRPLLFTNEQWTELFEYIQIYRESDRCLIKRALEPITENEYSINLEFNTEEDETTNIKEKCGEYALFVGNFCYLTNKEGKYTNQVYFQVDVVNDHEINELMKRLQNYKQIEVQQTAEINIRKYRVYSTR